MKSPIAPLLLSVGFLTSMVPIASAGEVAAAPIRHSYLVMGGKTAIISEEGKVEWE